MKQRARKLALRWPGETRHPHSFGSLPKTLGDVARSAADHVAAGGVTDVFWLCGRSGENALRVSQHRGLATPAAAGDGNAADVYGHFIGAYKR